MTHNEACTAIADACSDPEQEISEYLKRDIANVILGNKDNHSRNTAINRTNNGHITLTPLFDFAPMYLHPEGIARAIRWAQDDNGQPDWSSAITQAATASGLPPESLVAGLKPLASPLCTLGKKMRELNIPSPMVERAERLVEMTVKSLEAI